MTNGYYSPPPTPPPPTSTPFNPRDHQPRRTILFLSSIRQVIALASRCLRRHGVEPSLRRRGEVKKREWGGGCGWGEVQPLAAIILSQHISGRQRREPVAAGSRHKTPVVQPPTAEQPIRAQSTAAANWLICHRSRSALCRTSVQM